MENRYCNEFMKLCVRFKLQKWMTTVFQMKYIFPPFLGFSSTVISAWIQAPWAPWVWDRLGMWAYFTPSPHQLMTQWMFFFASNWQILSRGGRNDCTSASHCATRPHPSLFCSRCFWLNHYHVCCHWCLLCSVRWSCCCSHWFDSLFSKDKLYTYLAPMTMNWFIPIKVIFFHPYTPTCVEYVFIWIGSFVMSYLFSLSLHWMSLFKSLKCSTCFL